MILKRRWGKTEHLRSELRAMGPLSIYVSSMSGLDTGIEYATAFERQGTSAMVCLDPSVGTEAEEALRVAGVRFERLPSLSRPEVLLSRFHRNLISTATSFLMGGNPNYRVMGPAGGPRSKLKELPYRAIRRFPYWPNATQWNNWGPTLFGWMHRDRFPSNHVMAVSSAANPLFLCSRKLRVDTIVDSWDHPVRKVAGYPTRVAVAWNDDLARDWVEFQGASQTRTVISRRLRYALEALESDPTPKVRPLLLYPVATSTNIPDLFADEMKLLERTIDGAASADWEVLVKPRPDAIPQALRSLVASRTNACLGVQLNPSGGALDYRLTSDYNRARLREMADADLVLSTVTTFGLDAAAAGRPIVQLDLRDLGELPTLAAISSNSHLTKYLYQLPGTLTPHTLEEFHKQLQAVLWDGSVMTSAQASQRDLRSWVIGPGSDMVVLIASLAREKVQDVGDRSRTKRSRR